MKRITIITSLLLLGIYSCNEVDSNTKLDSSEVSKDSQQTNETKEVSEIPQQSEKLNDTVIPDIEIKDNIMQMLHHFKSNKRIGTPISLDLENTEGGMLSAYSLDTGIYRVFFREKKAENWEEWKELQINDEVVNPNRKVYAPVILESTTQMIQFKSDSETTEDVVFRLFIFNSSNQ